ncbi:uncharacterized protein LOC116775931 isoform X2 [Danaus plexippus]|uniref:uncharacterized protein LOC116775931 isoform X2 n=1 Tax=Danaus plexippus TaxID=13037 RepID=UPI002AAF1DD1|nr:uncharacterized protein LOC116775931 isoform X2 [Danaus plexippus]
MAGYCACFIYALFLLSVTCEEINDNESIDVSRVKREGVPENRAFNTNAIVYDNSPWRPGRDVEPERGEDERKLKNLATRIMSNGVEVLVKDRSAEEKQEQTRYSDVKTIQPSAVSNSFVNNNPKIDKRIDDDHNHFDLIEPSEMSHTSCSTSCTCSHIQTESLKTKYTNVKSQIGQAMDKTTMKSTKYSGTKIDVPPTHLSSYDHTKYHPYEYETSSHGPPTDKVVEKYTQVTDYSDENDSNSLDMSDLLTNEQAPEPPKTKSTTSKPPEKSKPDKPQKVNKNKFVVAELIKLGSLGIKGLSQLAPVIEKMTGGFMRRQETNRTTSTTTTVKPINKVVGYSANKRVDNEVESKHNNFPIYIPVDEMEMAESQIGYTNVTLQQNIAWAADHKNSKVNLMKSKIVHESPLVNGGIPISPGEIITTNSDVIVGKPAVGGPVSLVGTGMKLQNQAQAPDNAVAHSDMYSIKEKPLNDYPMVGTKIDDSYDLRPPELPKPNAMVNKNTIRPHGAHFSPPNIHIPLRNSGNLYKSSEHSGQISYSKDKSPNLVYHGRPSILDYKPSFTNSVKKPFENKSTNKENDQQEIPDNNPSSSEIVSTHIMTDGQGTDFEIVGAMNKPLLVDIQPSKVANVLIPHGSSTALVFAGSAEPHKTGDYVDDPLPYPEPGYFGSFSIDAPHMTNVHNVVVNKNQFVLKPNGPTTDRYTNDGNFNFKNSKTNTDQKFNWVDIKRPKDLTQSSPPQTSNQVNHAKLRPQLTTYNPEIYNGNFDKVGQVKNNPKEGNDVIDKEYENYLAVPPPPPKRHFNHDNRYDSSKPSLQRPNKLHSKPIQDGNVYVNIQHPVTNQLPPKITSEIYFASQLPSSQPTPTYNLKIPYPSSNPSTVPKSNHSPKQGAQTYSKNTHQLTTSSFPNRTLSSSNKENTYTITLNTATNVASKPGHVLGSSITVPITTTSDNGQINANIPIGTNFAIRVEDDRDKYESVALHGKIHPSLLGEDKNYGPSGNNNRYKVNYSIPGSNVTQIVGQKYNNDNTKVTIKEHDNKNVGQFTSPVINSHANFPMTNEDANSNVQRKQIINKGEKSQTNVHEGLSNLVPNLSTNSHGWYSSIFKDDNVKDINIETSTRKVIPLNYDINSDDTPYFGEKIATVGKPPSEYWGNKHTSNNFIVGKPFAKPTLDNNSKNVQPSIKPNLIPAIYGVKQTVYDIPIRDDKNVSSLTQTSTPATPFKQIYETADEIYDGEEEVDLNSEIDGEVSSESMKVPIISTPKERVNMTFDSTQFADTSSKSQNNASYLVNFNPGTQTEKPFRGLNKTSFHSNNINPIYNTNYYSKPKPFAMNTMPLDHQLQQPHWQINQLMENSTNVSYEDIEEEIHSPFPGYLNSTKQSSHSKESGSRYGIIRNSTVTLNNSGKNNKSNIITSVVHIHDQKPLVVEKTTSPPPLGVMVKNEVYNKSVEVIDLSPPPLISTTDYKLKPTMNNDEIMGMSPPTPPSRHPTRVPQTSRPVIPIRTPPPYRNVPQRTLPPRQTTPRPLRKPANRDEVSTYRPAFDFNKGIRPMFNYDQPSSPLLPPPRESPSKVIIRENIPKLTSTLPSARPVVFPTPVSSGWLTSSNIGFSSSFNFAPTSVYFPSSISQSGVINVPDTLSTETQSEESYDSSEYESSLESVNISNENSYETKNNDTNNLNTTRFTQSTTENNKSVTSGNNQNHQTSNIVNLELSEEHPSTEKSIIVSSGITNRTRKPYPFNSDNKKLSTNKFKYPSKTSVTIRPTKTLHRPELAPTRKTSIRKIVRPLPSKNILPTNIIESSESILEDDFMFGPTQVLQETNVQTKVPEIVSLIEKTVTSTVTLREETSNTHLHSVHHSGNEIKISDEIIPTKTEFKTTIITLTKTLSEPPQTISSFSYLNLTHTLTVTHTKTSLVSQSEGAVTETLVLTNTHTSTVVDVVTEIFTQVQPTTIVETVTKHIPVQIKVEPTSVINSIPNTKIVALDDISMSSEERDNFIIRDDDVTENIQKIEAEEEKDNDTFFVVMNKSQNGGKSPPINTDIDAGDYDGVTRNEQVTNNGVSQVLFGEILLAGTPYLETTNVVHPTGYGKECQPDCKASRNERCQRIDSVMKCVCRPGFARMFPDRPCKPTYTYSVRLGLGSRDNKVLKFHKNLSDNSTKEYESLSLATHEGINRMIMQSDLRDVYHGVHITGFHPIEMRTKDGAYQGVINDFYVQLSDNAHESRLKEVIEKYLRNNNYSLGGTEVYASEEFIESLNVSDFDECTSTQFNDCSEHARCFNLRGTYTCSCLEGFADLSVNTLYPGRICSSDAIGCAGCNYHGTCFDRENAMICECFKWYAGRTCQVNLKAVLITVTVVGALVIIVVTIWASKRCCSQKNPTNQTFVIGCMQGMPSLHQGNVPSKQRADRRALIAERNETAETCSVQNASLPYAPSKSRSRSHSKQAPEPPPHSPPPPPALMIPRARLHPLHDSRDNLSRRKSSEVCNEAKLISYLESGATNTQEMRRKHSIESSYSVNKERANKQGALVSAGYKVSTTIRPDENSVKCERDDTSSINKNDLEAELSRFDTLRKSYSQEDMSEWTDAERRIGELTLSEARSVGGTLPASTGRAASSTRLTHQTSDVSEFDSL